MLCSARKTLFLGNDLKDSQQFDINIVNNIHLSNINRYSMYTATMVPLSSSFKTPLVAI